MLYNIIVIIILAIVTESIVELISTGSIFFNIRNWFAKQQYPLLFIHDLVSCGYCFSVWISGLVAWITPIPLCGILIIDYIVTLFLIHRLSNIIHELFSRWFSRTPFTMFLTFNDNKRKK